MFRLKMMRPHGRGLAQKRAFIGGKRRPAKPVINARAAIGAD